MRRLAFAAIAVACVALAGSAAGGTGVQFYVPPPNGAAQHEIATLTAAGDATGAAALSALTDTSHAVWISGGTPNDARVLALKTVNRAAGKGELPVFALYDIPGRDCTNYSAGGATGRAAYEAWIDGVAAGLEGHATLVVLEPDALGLLPSSCSPAVPFTDADRYAELNYAVDTLGAAGAQVYLDATHGAWMGVGDIAERLINAGVLRARGFFVNVSNYRTTAESVTYGTWIAECIAVASTQTWAGDWAYGHPTWCPSQYSPPTYQLDWSAANIAAVNGTYAGLLHGTTPTTHFVVDTSRNGQGPLGAEWCNPPGRGAGIQPTTSTGSGLADAFLWVKVPGESDGQCHQGDPAAGVWFPQQALELATLASPALH